eukprot:TRINITY_DN521_c0_g1_i5.p2 TRINITY_DN521_c0_g1~~TRINITY_DN521_c0_g1_i5.p2  ORF type:complete len:357 (+),score=114.46 TRINITY_DN521_c0_g1_i5:1673-2743(+)
MAMKELLQCCEQACTIMTPLLTQLYKMVDSGIAKEKGDKSIFTVADGLVQCLVAEKLLGGTGMRIVGEEDAEVQIRTPPFTVDGLTIPQEAEKAITEAVEKLGALNAKLLTMTPAYKDLTAFIDPIDGSREFVTNLGEQCTVCIGFAVAGKPVAGIVYRPLSDPPTWASGCEAEGYTAGNITLAEGAGELATNLLTSNGSISPFIEGYLAKRPATRVKSGGVGNKMLMLLEGGSKMCYFQDRGVSRWDTCAAQAILESRGGMLVKLAPLISSGAKESYTYAEGTVNADFVPNEAKLTLYNCTDKAQAGELAGDVSQVRPYSNLAGLFAVQTRDDAVIAVLAETLKEVAKAQSPAYD